VVIGVFRADLREETLAWTPVALRQALDRLWFQQIGPKLEQRPGRNERQLGLKTMLQRIDLFDQSAFSHNSRTGTGQCGPRAAVQIFRNAMRPLLTETDFERIRSGLRFRV
jgi:hypothetical protein